MKAALATLTLCLALDSATVYGSDICNLARQVAETYVALDLQGEGTHASQKMNELIDYRDRDTPAWDSFTLTRDSRIDGCRQSGEDVVIAITHNIFGSVDATERRTLEAVLAQPIREEKTTLRLNKTPMGWKIDSSTVYIPHVGVAAAIRIFANDTR